MGQVLMDPGPFFSCLLAEDAMLGKICLPVLATGASLLMAFPAAADPLAVTIPFGAGPFGVAMIVSDNALGAVTGKADVQQQLATARNASTVSGNSVNGVSVTGQITIDAQAFQNLNGLSVLTANTGNNVSINASMNVNVAIEH